MLKNTLIILLIIALIYYYWQSKKPSIFTERVFVGTNSESANQTLVNLLRDQLNSDSLEAAKEKLGGKTLNELLEENEDYETEVDTLTRTKNSLEADLLAQSNAFQNRLREKDREAKKLKEDLGNLEKVREKLTSEKQQHKGSLERIKLLTEQITSLEAEKKELEKQLKKMPGEFPSETSSITSQELTDQSKLEAFIEWTKDLEEFKKVDWNYYRSQENWEKSFRNWNKLREDRIRLLKDWKESLDK